MGSRDLQEVRSSRRGRLVGGGEAFPVSKQTREALVSKPVPRKELHCVALTTPGTGQGCPQLSAGCALLEGSVGRGGGWSASELTHVAVGGARAARPPRGLLHERRRPGGLGAAVPGARPCSPPPLGSEPSPPRECRCRATGTRGRGHRRTRGPPRRLPAMSTLKNVYRKFNFSVLEPGSVTVSLLV